MIFGVSMAVLIAIVVGFFSVGYIFWLTFTRDFRKTLPPHFQSTAVAIQALAEATDSEAQLMEVLEKIAADIGGTVAMTPLEALEVDDDVGQRLSRGDAAFIFAEDDSPVLLIPVPSKGKIVVINAERRFPVPSNAAIALSIAVIMVIVFGTGLLLTLPLVKRLGHLERTASQIAGGDLSARASDGHQDAIGSLARQFDTMADRVQELLENQRQLLQAVAHELRTPAARIRFGLEMLPDAETAEEIDARLASIDDDLVELDELVRELQLFNKYDAPSTVLSSESTPLKAVLEELCVRLQPLRQEIALSVVGDEGTVAVVDKRAFNRALQNLISNALRYAETRVEVRVAHAGEACVVDVVDDGPGVPESDRERIVEPFARVDNSRNKESGGVGLGLAIVERILEAHAGSLEILDGDLGGANFRTTWPV